MCDSISELIRLLMCALVNLLIKTLALRGLNLSNKGYVVLSQISARAV